MIRPLLDDDLVLLYGEADLAQSWLEGGVPHVLVSGGSWDASAIGHFGLGKFPRVWRWDGSAWSHLETLTAPEGLGDPVLRVSAGDYWTVLLNGAGLNVSWERVPPADWVLQVIQSGAQNYNPQTRLVGPASDMTTAVAYSTVPLDTLSYWNYSAGWGGLVSVPAVSTLDPGRWWLMGGPNSICRTPDGSVRVCGFTQNPHIVNGLWPFIVQIRGPAVAVEVLIPQTLLDPMSTTFTAMWALSNTAVYAALAANGLHDPNQLWVSAGGGAWSVLGAYPSPLQFNFAQNAISGTSPSDVWVAGSWDNSGTTEPLVAHWDGSGWTSTAFPAYGWPTNFYTSRINDITAYSATDVWAVGTQITSDTDPFDTTRPFVLHFDGGAWTDVTPNPLA